MNGPRGRCPGGGVEPGEHPESAAVREVHEETGYDVAWHPLGTVTDLPRDELVDVGLGWAGVL